MITSIYPRTNSVTKTKTAEEVQYPEDVQIIIRSDTPAYGSLFLSNLEAAKNPHLLQKLKIGAILTAAKGCHLQHPKNIVKFSKYIPLEDNQKCEIYEYLDESVGFIQQKLKITNVLVHCVSGVSKSAAIAMAFMMKDRQLTLEDAFNEVKSRRKIIAPHKHILGQLKRYERELQEKINMTRLQTDRNTVNYNNLTIRTNRANPIVEKLKTNQSNISKVSHVSREKTVQQSKNEHAKTYANLLLPEDLDDMKSMRSYRSNNNNSRYVDLDKSRSEIKNPEDSFISKRSHQQSKHDKSFNKSRPRSERSQDNIILDQLENSPNLSMSRRSSVSRDEFNKKMRKVDSLNEEINQKLGEVQQRFETENKAHRQALDKELGQIYQMKTQIYSQYNQRKSRMATKRTMHNETMQDINVKIYIYNLPVPGIGVL